MLNESERYRVTTHGLFVLAEKIKVKVYVNEGKSLSTFKKLINNSRGKYKRNECLINVCKSDTDLS